MSAHASVEPLPVAVVIAFYKADATFPAALASVMAQSRRPAEILVVDDGSPAGSAGSLERLPAGVRFVRLGTNVGVNGARRAGTVATTAPLLAYLDADDVWPPDYLGSMVEALRAWPEAPAVYAATEKVWPDGRREAFTNKPHQLDIKEAIVRSHAVPSAMLMRRSAVEAVGGWNDDRWVIDDWHMTVRMIDKFGPMIHVPGVVIEYHVGNAGSLNSKNVQVLRQWWRTLHQLGPMVERHFGKGAARRRFAKALLDRSYRFGRLPGMALRFGAWMLGPPLDVDQPRAS